MKLTITSFLFFCFLLFYANSSIAQVTDSLSYYSNLVYNPVKSEDLTKAYLYITKVNKINEKKNNLYNKIYCNLLLAEIKKKLGSIPESERLHLQCLELIKKVGDPDKIITTYYITSINALGIIYRDRKDYKRAISLYDEAIAITTAPDHLSSLLNNKGQVYQAQNKLDTARVFYENAFNKALETENVQLIARSLSNLSFVKSMLDLPDAEEGLLKALDYRVEINHTSGIGSSYDHLARFYKSKNDTINMNMYTEMYYSLANKAGMGDLLQGALRLKIETTPSEYPIKYLALNDSLIKNKEEQRNDFNYYYYQNDKKEKDLQDSKLNNERLLYLLLFIGLASISIYFILKFKHKKEKLQEVYQTETRISRKIHDEVANDVYHVMTQLQTNSNGHKELLDDLENIYNRTRDISKQNSSIDLSIPYIDLLSDLFLGYKNEHINILTKDLQLINWENLNDIKKSTLYRVLQELLTNMRKHSGASIVVFNFISSSNTITIKYNDNGVGTKLLKGNGLQNTENRINSINGTITFESELEKGFKAIITI